MSAHTTGFGWALSLLVSTAAAAAPSAPAVRIPLVQGLVEVTAVQRPNGDEEQVMTITEANAERIGMAVEFRSLRDGKLDVVEHRRTLRRADLLSSNRLNQVFQPGDPALFPGATLSMLSANSLAELKSAGRTAIVLGTLPSLGDAVAEMPLMSAPTGRKYFRGDLVRVGTDTVPMTVQVNGESVVLETVQARASLSVARDTVDVELWVLDDPALPIILRSGQGRSLSQTVRIDYPTPRPRATVLEAALAQGCRAELHGVYFDFGQATLLPASTPALAAVAQLMKAHADWTLRIEGHTDSVGGAAYNQSLSQRRAEAVRDALTKTHGLAPTRLQATGLGQEKPVASNDTLEGRAANRRVELTRQCP